MGSHPLNLILRFLLEVAALFSVGLWGWTQSDHALRYILALGIPVLFAVIWATFAVPKDPMKQSSDKSAGRTHKILLILLGFLGLSALGGGGALIISPSGALIGLPISHLDNAPFRSFLVPGIILFSVLGLFPVLLIPALLKKPDSAVAQRINMFRDMHWSWTFSIYIAFILIGWIQIQMVIVQTVHWLHTFYMFYGVILLVCALLPSVRSFYRMN